MSRSTSDSFRDNEVATSTFATPFGTPFFGWTEDGEWRKLTMDELRSEYEAWESRRVGECSIPLPWLVSDVLMGGGSRSFPPRDSELGR